MNLKHFSFFTGFLGFDLAAEWAGWDNVAFCENNKYCQRLIRSKYPKHKIYEDIRKFRGRPYRGTIDVVSGGFPCQPFSVSGQLKGSEDDRYLWPEMLRVVDEIRPRWFIGENVANLATMEQSNCVTIMETNEHLCTEAELVVQTIKRDLEEIGYRVEFLIIPACAVGAFHQRQRIWILANSDSHVERKSKKSVEDEAKRFTSGESIRGRKLKTIRHRGHLDISRTLTGDPIENEKNITGIPGIDDGFSNWIHRTHGIGNAISPQLAYEIFYHINKIEKNGR